MLTVARLVRNHGKSTIEGLIGTQRAGILPAGNVSGAITELIRVAEFVPALVDDAIAVLDGLGARIDRESVGLR